MPELGLEIERALRQVAHKLKDEAQQKTDAEGVKRQTESQRTGMAPKSEANRGTDESGRDASDRAAMEKETETHGQEEARIRDEEARASAATGGRTGGEEGIKR